MNIEQFEIFERRLRDARSPEQFFGKVHANDTSAYKDARDKEWKHLQKITKDAENANHEFRINIATSLFLLLDKWGLQKVTEGVYGNYTTYRLKLLFEVRKTEDGNLHFFLIRNRSLHRPQIWGELFEDGYLHSDEVCILREGVPIKKGSTREYGTHGAQTCFHGIEEKPLTYLVANDFAEYDMVEINTWKYGSFPEFIARF